MTEEILIKVELDKPETDKQVNELSKSITTLTTENKNLIATNKELEKQGKANSKEYLENTKQIEINKQKINENNSSRKNLIQAIIAEDNSIKGLQIRNRELVQQRNLISTATEEGREAIKKINEEIDKNNDIIKENSSSLEKQRLNVGNYTDSIKQAISETKIAGTSIGDLTAKVASFANPVTAAVAVLGALTAAYMRSSIGAKDLEFAKNKLTSAVNILTDRFAALFSSAEDGEGFFSKLLDRTISLVKYIPIVALYTKALGVDLDEINQKSTDAALASDQLNAIYEDRELILAKVAERQAENSELLTELADATKTASERQKIAEQIQANALLNQQERVASIDAEIEAIRKKNVGIEDEGVFIKEINALERQKAQIATQTTKEIEKAQKQLNAILRAEEKARQAEKTALAKQELAERLQLAKDIADADRQQFENNRALLRTQADERLLLLKFQYEQGIIQQEEYENSKLELEIAALEREREFLIANGEETLAIEQSILDKKIALKNRETAAEKKLAQERVAVAKAEQQQKELLAQQALATAQTIFGRSKTASSLLTTISTYFAAQKAFESQFLPVPTPSSPVRGAIAAALAVVQGLARVAQINAVPGFARGGILKPSMGRPIQRSNGDDRLITAKVGETILTREQTARVGTSRLAAAGVPGFATGGIVGNETRIAAGQAESQFDINRLAGLINGIQPVLVYQDFEIAQDNILGTRNRAQVI